MADSWDNGNFFLLLIQPVINWISLRRILTKLYWCNEPRFLAQQARGTKYIENTSKNI